MKNRVLLYSTFLLLPLLASCGDEGYSIDKFSVAHDASYQLWDNFDYGNLKVSYDGTELETYQYDVDLSKLDLGKVGESAITVSLKEAPEISLSLPIQTTYRDACNLLCVGSSCVSDAVAYANEIVKNTDESLKVNIYAAVAEDASLDDHYAYFATGNAAYSFLSYNSSASSWASSDGKAKTLQEILNGGISFDAICLSEESPRAGKEESFKNLSRFASSLSSFCESLGKKAPSLSYLLPWAYQDNVVVDNSYYEDYENSQNTMYHAIVDACQKKVVASKWFNTVLPIGTAIQNARSSSFPTTNDFTSDGKNLDQTYGEYLTSLCLVSALTGHQSSYFSRLGPGSVEYVTEKEKTQFDKIVDSAISNPYQITKTDI